MIVATPPVYINDWWITNSTNNQSDTINARNIYFDGCFWGEFFLMQYFDVTTNHIGMVIFDLLNGNVLGVIYDGLAAIGAGWFNREFGHQAGDYMSVRVDDGTALFANYNVRTYGLNNFLYPTLVYTNSTPVGVLCMQYDYYIDTSLNIFTTWSFGSVGKIQIPNGYTLNYVVCMGAETYNSSFLDNGAIFVMLKDSHNNDYLAIYKVLDNFYVSLFIVAPFIDPQTPKSLIRLRGSKLYSFVGQTLRIFNVDYINQNYMLLNTIDMASLILPYTTWSNHGAFDIQGNIITWMDGTAFPQLAVGRINADYSITLLSLTYLHTGYGIAQGIVFATDRNLIYTVQNSGVYIFQAGLLIDIKLLPLPCTNMTRPMIYNGNTN